MTLWPASRAALGVVGALVVVALTIGAGIYLYGSAESFGCRESYYPHFDERLRLVEGALRKGQSSKAQVRELLAAHFAGLRISETPTGIEAGLMLFVFDGRGIMTDYRLESCYGLVS